MAGWGRVGQVEEGVVLFRAVEENREGGGGAVPCRMAVTAETELRRLKTRGVLCLPPPPPLPLLPPALSSPLRRSRGPRRIVTEFLGFSVIFYDFRIA